MRVRWREWWPLLLYLVVLVALLSTAWIGYDRHLLPALPVAPVFAAFAVRAVAGRNRVAAWSLVALAACGRRRAQALPGLPARGLRPCARLIEAHARPGARVFLAEDRLGIDGSRFTVWRPTGSAAFDRVRALQADAVATRPDDPLAAGLTRVFEAERDDPRRGGRSRSSRSRRT